MYIQKVFWNIPEAYMRTISFNSFTLYMHDFMKCSAKFYGMQVSMTRQYGDF